MTTFTAGPWHVGPHYKSDVESRDGRICECRPFGSPRAESNANLIAAAPELLEALKASVANHCGDSAAFCSTCTPARKLIAKAEGRQA